jgi:hypothetical protein
MNCTVNLINGIFLLSVLISGTAFAAPMTTAFTYQGSLQDGGSPAHGAYDIRFSLYDAQTGGDLAGTVTNSATPVTNGLFTATLDFGPGVFTGEALWLDLAARRAGTEAFTPLTPRQPLAASPYALYANVAQTASNVSASNITGQLMLGQLPEQVVTNAASSVSLSGTFAGNGAGLTGIEATNVSSIDPANTILLSVGHSRCFNLFEEMKNDTRFLGYPIISNAAVSGSTVAQAGTVWTNLLPQVAAWRGAGYTVLVTIWTGANDFGNFTASTLSTYSNICTSIAGSGCLLYCVTDQPIGDHDTPAGYVAIAWLNNWIRECFLAWRVRDAQNDEPDCFNTNIFYDTFHESVGLGTVRDFFVPAYLKEIYSPTKTIWPQCWNFVYGTNWVSIAPGSSNSAPTLLNVCGGANVGWTLSDGSSLSFGLGGVLSICGPGSLWNQFIGNASGNAAATGYWNVGLGQNTLTGIASGIGNTALGYYSMAANTTGTENTAEGGFALWSNTAGNYNLANGYASLFNNVSGSENVAVGYYAMYCNTGGVGNIAVGTSALKYNTSGNANAAIGTAALYANANGGANVAVGEYALTANTSGNENTAVGSGALGATTTGSYNVGLGSDAGANVTGGSSGNTFIGPESAYSFSSGSGNICLGSRVDLPLSTGSGQLNIGNLIQGTGAYNSQSASSSNLVTGGVVTIGGGLRYPQQSAAPTAASIGGTVGSVTNHLIMNVNGQLTDYWSDGKTLYSKRLAP